MISDSFAEPEVKGMFLFTIYKVFSIEICPWKGGREVTKFYTRRLWPKVRDLSILQCF